MEELEVYDNLHMCSCTVTVTLRLICVTVDDYH